MRYRLLGRTGLKVSELCLGTMTFGTKFFNIAEVGQAGASEMVSRSLEAGVNFFDTADVYSYGESEEVLGRAVRDSGIRRESAIIATKVRSAMTQDGSALNDLVRQGKVRYIGCSNWSVRHLMKSLGVSELHGWERFVSLQAYYSLVGRDLEHELLPLCLEEGLGVLPWSPLSGGFLTGKYRRENPSPEGARRTNFQFPPIDEARGFDAVDALEE